MCETNLLYDRYHFFERCQKGHETFIEYVEEIKRLAKTCKFDVLEQSLIRDRAIFGIKNKKIRTQIIENGGDPTLDETIVLCEALNGKSEKNRRIVKDLDHISAEGKLV